MDNDQTADGKPPPVSPDEAEEQAPPTLGEQSAALLEISARLQQRCQMQSLRLQVLLGRSEELLAKTEALMESLPRRPRAPERW